MKVLQEVEAYVNDFNKRNDEDFNIDSIRIEFSKQHKLESLKKLGRWKKLKNNSNILYKLKKRLLDNNVTSVWRLEEHNIYYYNLQDPPKYRRATLVIFGIQQYHKDSPPRELTSEILSILKNVSNVDICVDLLYKPNTTELKKYFKLTPYITNNGLATDTRYINATGIPMIEKIIIYNKAYKNNLPYTLWRIEAKMVIPNFKFLALPLYEFKKIIEMVRIVFDIKYA